MQEMKEVYTYSDQPVTCPNCGSRTEIMIDLYYLPKKAQVHRCLDEKCNSKFVTQEDI